MLQVESAILCDLVKQANDDGLLTNLWIYLMLFTVSLIYVNFDVFSGRGFIGACNTSHLQSHYKNRKNIFIYYFKYFIFAIHA